MVNNRSMYLTYAEWLKYPSNFTPAIQPFFDQDATINIVHPFNKLDGSKDYIEDLDKERESSFELG